MARIKMPAARSKAKELTFEEAFNIFLTDSAARKYLMDCGGNAFTLQKLLGHSTLKTTKIYCNIFDADIARNYDEFSPLAQIKSSRQTVRR